MDSVLVGAAASFLSLKGQGNEKLNPYDQEMSGVKLTKWGFSQPVLYDRYEALILT